MQYRAPPAPDAAASRRVLTSCGSGATPRRLGRLDRLSQFHLPTNLMPPGGPAPRPDRRQAGNGFIGGDFGAEGVEGVAHHGFSARRLALLIEHRMAGVVRIVDTRVGISPDQSTVWGPGVESIGAAPNENGPDDDVHDDLRRLACRSPCM